METGKADTAVCLFVLGAVVLLLELVEVGGEVVPEGGELAVAGFLEVEEHLGVVRDGLVDGGEVVEDEVLLDVRDELHEALAGAHHVGGAHLHLEGVLLALRGPGDLGVLLDADELGDLVEVGGHRVDVVTEALAVRLEERVL